MYEVKKVSDSCSAVTRVYRQLRDKGIPDVSAYETAAKVFQLRHPKMSERDSRFTIAEWLEKDQELNSERPAVELRSVRLCDHDADQGFFASALCSTQS